MSTALRNALCLGFVLPLLSACGGGGSVSPAATPPLTQAAAPAAIAYTALGDSITYGAGASSICAPRAPVTPCAGATNFPPLVAERLHLSIADLATDGARVHDVLASQVPAIDTRTAAITLYVGTNDLWDAADTSDVPSAVARYVSAYRNLLAAIVARAPAAKIAIFNIPDLSRLPFFQSSGDAAYLGRLHQASVLADAQLASLGYPLIDLYNDPLAYDRTYLESQGLHPDDAGYAHLATLAGNTLGAMGL